MYFHTRLKRLRQRHKMTQHDLAEILGVKPSTIANYESNRNEPAFDKLIVISTYFNVSIDYLLGRTEECHSCIFHHVDANKLELIHQISGLRDNKLLELKNFIDFLYYKQERP